MTPETLNQEQINEWRWQIIQAKNPEFDNAFYTGVRSTRIYCKPSCPARTPKRENVVFFASCDDAEKNGFRACLRCKPRNANAINESIELVRRVCRLLETNLDKSLSLEFLGEELKISPAHLQRIFKSVLGISPKDFANAQRLQNFKRQVRQTNVTTALYDSGFGSSRALYEKVEEKLGMTPAVYRKNGKNMKISFAIADCSLGKLLIAATEKGVCSIKFGDDAKELEEDLKQEFSAAETSHDETNLRTHLATILELLSGEQKTIDLPLDLQATAFQLRVWQELRKIPRGETRSYKQIAEAIEQPSAVRAVARACAINPIALVTPCHRVVGSDGKLTGYRWGVERKKQLLESEKSQE